MIHEKHFNKKMKQRAFLFSSASGQMMEVLVRSEVPACLTAQKDNWTRCVLWLYA